MSLKENPQFGNNILDIQKHLDAAGVGYLNSINGTTPESLITTMKKLSPFARHLVYPDTVVSVGIGQGEEIEALYELFGRNGTRLIGVDLSTMAINSAIHRTQKNGIPMFPIMASATDIPLRDSSINGVILSSILHEVYSYLPNGMASWQKTIGEAARILSEDGILFLRDPESPDEEDVNVRFLSDFSQDFYNYFRREFRTFSSWDKEIMLSMLDRRPPDQEDYPSLDPSQSIIIPLAKAAEVMLHFRNFWNDFHKDLVKLGDPGWKEMDEAYLLPNPTSKDHILSVNDYIQTVLDAVNNTSDSDPRIICVQQSTIMSPETNIFLTRHFALSRDGKEYNPLASATLIGQTTRKMELVFKKVV